MQTLRPLAHAIAVAVFCSSTLASADSGSIVRDSVRIETYDGVRDDLLSAGLNQAGLVSAAPPPFADPNHPTAAELRRRAIYGNYRGIVDPVPGGGMGLLWGPQSPGTPVIPGATFGLIPGVEYQAYLRVRDAHGHVNNVPAAVQIPAHFNPAKPCLVAAVPSGSRSVWGGIAIAEWALFKGCAVALPGKGTDTGFHLLGKEAAAWAVNDLAGMYGSTAAIGEDAQFALRSSPALEAYVAANPFRIATKHAHSQLNPERLWGQFALEGIEFAFWALNDHFDKKGNPHGDKRFDRKNTLVIAAGASNGGDVALRALEEDGKGLIDGLVVTEPNIGPEDGRFVIRFGSDAPFDPAGRSLYDSITLMSVYAACASLAPGAAGTPFVPPPALAANRCTSLSEKGLVSGTTTAEHAASALAALRAHGYAAAQDWGIASHDTLNLWRSLQPTYANAYGRFAIEDNLCGVSFAATDAAGKPAAISELVARQLFANSSGIPSTGAVTIAPGVTLSGVNLIADRATNGPILENLAVSRSTKRQDLNLDSALCFRALQTGEGLASGEDWVVLYVVEMGGNDIRDAIVAYVGAGGGPNGEHAAGMVIAGALQSVGDNIFALYRAGARKFLVWNAPNLGLTPAIRALDSVSPGAVALANALSVGFNQGLDFQVLAGLSGLPGIEIVRFDVYGRLQAIVADPSAFGLTNVRSACITPQSAPYHCKEFREYLFWDGIHPTAAAHAIVAQQVAETLR